MNNKKLDLPLGFRYAATAAGIKASGKLDLAVIVSDTPAASAGVFTRNRIVAAPVLVTEPECRSGQCQAILVNSGNANACTGDQGVDDALECRKMAASALGVEPELVAVSSTGIIGVPLPMDCFHRHIAPLIQGLSAEDPMPVAEAIRTTDAFTKVSSREVMTTEGPIRILGIAKGAGMIHPNMGTMLAFILTDAAIPADRLQRLVQEETDRSFNAITVDGDTSTNDMVLMLANGATGIDPPLAERPVVAAAVREILTELAKMIVRDGEGATKLVTVKVEGARTPEGAAMAARAIATSNLVKTAFFGQDPNWGRIIAALGYSGAEVEQSEVDIFFDDVQIVQSGLGLGADVARQAATVLQQPEFTVRVTLNRGEESAFYYTSDLTYDYVRINAEYHT